MKVSLLKIFQVIIGVLLLNYAHAQGGGPPMLTDDPATVAIHTWEINTSIHTQFTDDVELEVPRIDVNYGISNRVHLKIEAPYLIDIDRDKTSFGRFDQPLIGVKIHFRDEDKKFISMSTYPQATVTGNQKNFLLPLLLAKTIGKFVVGEEIGYLFIEKNSNNLVNGNLISYKLSDKLELMGEFFLQHSFNPVITTQGFMNYGCRYTFNKTFTFIGSCGTQVITPAQEQRQTFFSYIGLQTDF